ncbi:S-adenosyl-L-methionine-dependent methyltransferase [Mycena alexandri]|uniref:S-adenosyl-L-methionine-dependent methyltransferase n=1 Tax=Mycena alexandri TaxID=1745969 RepID=A0AAD6RV73_9AGAR|nr:S-adenosyl-L-methionine-dependent methyltransferase [Mycena alexandri]
MASKITPESLDLWTRSDHYTNSFLIRPDPVLDAVVQNTMDKGVEHEIAVSPAQGKFLHLILLSIGAKRVLEVGSLGGYSAIWMARALPDDGEVVTLELNELHAEVIAENVKTAGLSSKVKPEPLAPFDFVFIDADKESATKYFIEAKRLLRKGGVIIVDNVGQGWPVDPSNTESGIEGARELLRYIKDDTEVEATVIHTVGAKGFDGFLYAISK